MICSQACDELAMAETVWDVHALQEFCFSLHWPLQAAQLIDRLVSPSSSLSKLQSHFAISSFVVVYTASPPQHRGVGQTLSHSKSSAPPALLFRASWLAPLRAFRRSSATANQIDHGLIHLDWTNGRRGPGIGLTPTRRH